jgi:hypothetical protein
MKTLTILSLYWITQVISIGQPSNVTDNYLAAMQKNIGTLYQSDNVQELQTAVNALQRIADKEKEKWEPLYYIGFGDIMLANAETSAPKKDEYLNKAMIAVEKAKAIVPNEAEVVALEGFVHMIRITVDPAARGAEYSPRAMQAFGKAGVIDPENPRVIALLAQMQFGTARFFGTPPTDACASTRLALEKFETYKSQNPLAPAWGKAMTEGLLANCK